jgi:AraC-like DNA-binding protein
MESNEQQWMRTIRRYVAYCFRTGSVPRVDELAEMLHLSRATLTWHVRRAAGQSPGAAIRALQLRRAMTLLTHTEQTTAEIAHAAGYGSTRAFYRAFRRATGVSPSTFRREREDFSQRRFSSS